MLTNRRLLQQQWGGSHVPIMVASVDRAALVHANGAEVVLAWCNDAMLRLADRKPHDEQDSLCVILDSNPRLRSRVRDLLDQMAKGVEVVAHVMECSLTSQEISGSLRNEALSVRIIPFYLEVSSSSETISRDSVRCGWNTLLPTCFRRPARSILKYESFCGLENGITQQPALLLQCQPRSQTFPFQPSFSRPHGPVIPRGLPPFRTANPPLAALGVPDIGEKPPPPPQQPPHDARISFSPLLGGSTYCGNRSTMGAAINRAPSTIATDFGLTRQFTFPSTIGRQLTHLRNSTAGRLLTSFGAANMSLRGAGGGDVDIEGRSLRERRNSLALASVPIAVTIFALPSGAVLHQNAASLEYYGDRTSQALLPTTTQPTVTTTYGTATTNAVAAINNNNGADIAGQVPLRALLETICSDEREFDTKLGGGGDEVGKAAPLASATLTIGTRGPATLRVSRGVGLCSEANDPKALEPQLDADLEVSTDVRQLKVSNSVHLPLPAQKSGVGEAAGEVVGDGGVARHGCPIKDSGVGSCGGPAGDAMIRAGGGSGEGCDWHAGDFGSAVSGGGGGGDAAAVAVAAKRAMAAARTNVSVDCGASVVVVEMDVLRQLFSYDYGKLERMLAALTNEGDVWQGIIRVPETLNKSAHHEGEGGNADDPGRGHGTDADRMRQHEAAAKLGSFPGVETNPDRENGLEDDGGGDGVDGDILGSMGSDFHEAMRAVTEGLRQRLENKQQPGSGAKDSRMTEAADDGCAVGVQRPTAHPSSPVPQASSPAPDGRKEQKQTPLSTITAAVAAVGEIVAAHAAAASAAGSGNDP
ncbi:hypothetical protein Vretimale_11128, partial [Volvox reticuliferus]